MADVSSLGLPSVTSLLVYSICIVLLSYYCYIFQFSSLQSFSGPTLWALTPIKMDYHRLKGDIVHRLLELHEVYGPVVRIAPNELSWIDARVWTDAFGHRRGQEEFIKDPAVFMPHPNGHHGILSANRIDHARYRRALAHNFSDQGIQKQESVIAGYVDELCSGLHKTSAGQAIDMVEWLNWTTFDIIGRLALGSDFSCLRHARTHPWIAFIFGNLKTRTFVAALKKYGFQKLLMMFASKRVREGSLRNWQFVSDQIESRAKLGAENGDFFDRLFTNFDNEDGMSLEEIKSNASNIVLAGSETTATLLAGCLWLLCSNPSKMQLATDEIRAAFMSSKQINSKNTAELKYLHAVLQEAMRLYPPVPLIPARVTPQEGATIAEMHVPGGTVISFPLYVAGRLSINFEQADEFVPERFLSTKNRNSSDYHKDNFPVLQPFSYGPRNCIGRNLAYSEMHLILARLLYDFDFELAVQQKGDWIEQKSFVLWEKAPLWLLVRPVARNVVQYVI